MNKALKLEGLKQIRKQFEAKRKEDLRKVDMAYKEIIQPIIEGRKKTKKQFNDTYKAIFKQLDKALKELEKSTNTEN